MVDSDVSWSTRNVLRGSTAPALETLRTSTLERAFNRIRAIDASECKLFLLEAGETEPTRLELEANAIKGDDFTTGNVLLAVFGSCPRN